MPDPSNPFRDAVAIALALAHDDLKRGVELTDPYGLDKPQRDLVIALAMLVKDREDAVEWLEGLARGGAGR